MSKKHTILNEKLLELYYPDSVSPPGHTLADLMDRHQMSVKELSEKINYTENKINNIIKGKCSITHDIASKLELVFNVPLLFWLRREDNYRRFIG